MAPLAPGRTRPERRRRAAYRGGCHPAYKEPRPRRSFRGTSRVPHSLAQARRLARRNPWAVAGLKMRPLLREFRARLVLVLHAASISEIACRRRYRLALPCMSGQRRSAATPSGCAEAKSGSAKKAIQISPATKFCMRLSSMSQCDPGRRAAQAGTAAACLSRLTSCGRNRNIAAFAAAFALTNE